MKPWLELFIYLYHPTCQMLLMDEIGLYTPFFSLSFFLFFFFFSPSSSLLPWVCMRVSIAGLKKKLWHVGIDDEETEREGEKWAANHRVSILRVFVQWFPLYSFFFFSLRSPRTVVEAHIKLILLIQTSYTCPFFVRMCIYTLQYCQRKVIFLPFSSFRFFVGLLYKKILLFVRLMMKNNVRILIEFNCISLFALQR